MDILDKAIAFATKAHEGMTRKMSYTPYILHPMEAAVIVGTMTPDREVIAAALLHDTVEDTKITLEEIYQEFGKRVGDLVKSETEDKREDRPPQETWEIRKKESIEELEASGDIAVKMLWLGDKLSNMRGFYQEYQMVGDAIWESFNQKDPNKQAWYYRSIVKALEPLHKYPAWQEYAWRVERVFEHFPDPNRKEATEDEKLDRINSNIDILEKYE